jgi:hypothetical protein
VGEAGTEVDFWLILFPQKIAGYTFEPELVPVNISGPELVPVLRCVPENGHVTWGGDLEVEAETLKRLVLGCWGAGSASSSRNARLLYRVTSLISKRPPPPGPLQGPRHRTTVGSYGGTFSYGRGTPVLPRDCV